MSQSFWKSRRQRTNSRNRKGQPKSAGRQRQRGRRQGHAELAWGLPAEWTQAVLAALRGCYQRPCTSRGQRSVGFRAGTLAVDCLSLETLEDRRLLAASSLGEEFSFLNQFVAIGDETYFVAQHEDYGSELWKTDGTATGTQLVKDIRPDTASSQPDELVVVGSNLYFTADDGTGRKLWKSDGTSAGTSPIDVFAPGWGIATNIQHLTPVGDTLFFSGGTPLLGTELLKYDTVTESPGLVKNIWEGNGASSAPEELTEVNGELYFTAYVDGSFPGQQQGRELWKSDGTESGTELVKDLLTGDSPNGPSSSVPLQLTASEDRVFFTTRPIFFNTNQTATTLDLWVSDGTDAGTVQLSTNTKVDQLTASDGKLYFVSDDGSNGEELWVSDGTVAGTKLVRNIRAGAGSPGISELVAARDQVFVVADDGVNGRELWRSDGTTAGTYLVTDLAPEPDSLAPSSLHTVGNVVLFTAYGEPDVFSPFPDSDVGLWMSDGIDTVRIDDGSFAPVYASLRGTGDAIYFDAMDTQQLTTLWTYTNTDPVANFGGPFVVSEGSGPLQLDASASSDLEEALDQYEWDFDYDGAQFDVDATGVNPTFDATTDGPYATTVALRVRDFFGATSVATATVTVENVAPLIEGVGDLSSELGDAITFTSDVTDAGALDALTYEWDLGDGTTVSGVNQTTFQHTYEAAGEYFASLTVTDSDGAVAQKDFRVVIAPPVQFTSSSQTVEEGEVTIELTAEYAIVAMEDIVIPLQFGGRAVEGADFTTSNQAIVIPAGSQTGSVTITVFEDALSEDTEKIVVAMEVPQNASLGPNSAVEITVLDDDPLPRVSLTESYLVADENGQMIPLVARLSEVAGRDVVILVDFSGSAVSADYTISATEIVIAAGQQVGQLDLKLTDDNVAEGTELIVASLQPSLQAELSALPGEPIVQTIEIPANDAPTVRLVSANRVVDESVGQIDVGVQLSNPSANDVTIPITVQGEQPVFSWFFFSTTNPATPGDDFELVAPSPGTELVISAGETTGVVTLSIIDDAIGEEKEKLEVKLGTPTNATLGSGRSTTVAIEANDTPMAEIASTHQVVFEDEGTVSVQATLSNTSATDVTIPLDFSGTASAGSSGFFSWGDSSRDYEQSADSIVIPAGQLTGSIDVTLIDDDINEEAETIWIAMGTITGANRSGKNSQLITIRDDDPIVRFSTTETTKISEGDGSQVVQVVLSAATNKTVTVPFTVTGDATPIVDFTISPSSQLVIPAGETKAYFLILPTDDTVDESEYNSLSETIDVTEELVIGLESPSNASFPSESEGERLPWDFGINIERIFGEVDTESSDTTHVVVISDDDTPPLVRLSANTFVTEGERHNITAILTSPAIQDVEIFLEPGDGFSNDGTATASQDYSLSSSVITIPAGQKAGAVQLTIVDDAIYDPNEDFPIRIDRVINAIDPATQSIIPTSTFLTFKIRDNDLPTTVIPSISPRGALIIDTSDGNPINVASSNFASPTIGTTTATLPPGTGFLAVSLDGYLEGSTAFFDGNKNGVLDFLDLDGNRQQGDGEPSEPSTATAVDGSFRLSIPDEFDIDGNGLIDTAEGQLTVAGGVDQSILTAFPLRLVAPIGYYAVTPITTIAASLLDDRGLEFSLIEERMLQAFGLPAMDLQVENTIVSASQGNIDAAKLFSVNAQIQDTVVQVAGLVSGLPGTPPLETLADRVFEEMALRIVEPSSVLDLAEPAVIADLVRGLLSRTGLTLSEDQIQAAAVVVAEGNRRIQEIPTSSAEYLDEVARIQQVSQSVVAAAMPSLADEQVDIQGFVTGYTGLDLDERIINAQIGNVAIPGVIISDAQVTEGDAGQTVLEFVVLPDRASNLPMSVEFRPWGGTAIAGEDFVATSGTLEWSPGDGSARTIHVEIIGDTDFEVDEHLTILLENPSNLALRRNIGNGLIFNDDALVYGATSSNTQNDLAIRVRGTAFVLAENGTTVVAGQLSNPVPIEVHGAPNAVNSLVVSVAGPSTVFDEGLTFVGGNDNDALHVEDSRVGVVKRLIQTTESGQLELDSGRIIYSGVEEVADVRTPSVAIVQTSVLEGSSVQLSAQAGPFNFAEFESFTWSLVLAGETVQQLEGPSEFAFTPTEDGAYTVVLESRDVNGQEATVEMTIAVNNVAPTLTLDPISAIDENGTATLTGTITDPGTLDTFTLEVNWGDPQSPNNVETYSFPASATGSQTFSLTHQYLDDNPTGTASDQYSISATVTDDEGAANHVSAGFESAFRLGASGFDLISGVEVDAAGNIYVAGAFDQTVDFDPGPDTFNLSSQGDRDAFVASYSSAGDLRWARSMGGPGEEVAWDVAVDQDGNVFATGYFEQTADFDPGTSNWDLISAGSRDAFVVKLDNSGNFAWARQLGDTGADSSNAIAVDSAGSVYTTGQFFGTADFDPGPTNFELTSQFVDAFVWKLNSDGSFASAGLLGGSDADTGRGLAVDSSDNLYITGDFRSTADFDPTSGSFLLTSNGGNDVFVAKLSSTGAFQWAAGFGGSDVDRGRGIATDPDGNVVTTGEYYGTVDFDPGVATSSLTTVSLGTSPFVSKLDPNGGLIWARSFDITTMGVGHGVTTDSLGNVYATGQFSGTIDLDPGLAVEHASANGTSFDMYTVSLDESGDFRWGLGLGGESGSDLARGVAVDDSQNTFVVGNFGSTVDFDPSSATASLSSQGFADAFVWKLSQSGTLKLDVHNVAPALTLDPVSAIDENGTATLTGTITDPGTLDTFTLEINWGDPQSPNNVETYAFEASTTGSQTFTLTHQYLDDNPSATPQDSYAIHAVVTDDDGSSATGVTFQYSPPSLDQSFTPAANLHMGLASPNELAQTFTAGVDGVLSGVDVFLANASATTANLELTIRSTTGGVPGKNAGDVLATVIIPNSELPATGAVAEFVSVDLSSSAIPVAAGDVLAISLTLDQPNEFAQWFGASTDAYPGGGVFFRNDDASAWSSSTGRDLGFKTYVSTAQPGSPTVTVSNVAPTLVLEPVVSIDENGTATLTGTITDPGPLDTHTVTIDWGDNDTDEIEISPLASRTFVDDEFDDASWDTSVVLFGTGGSSAAFQQPSGGNPGTYRQVDITLDPAPIGGSNGLAVHSFLNGSTYDPSSEGAIASLDFTVDILKFAGSDHRLGPALRQDGIIYIKGFSRQPAAWETNWLSELTASDFVQQGGGGTPDFSATGSPIELGFFFSGTVFDGQGDTYSYGFDNFNITVNSGTGRTFSVAHQYLDDDPTSTPRDNYAINVTVADDDTGAGSATQSVVVKNVAPELVLDPVSAIDENGEATLTGTIIDPGTLDTFTLEVNWGDPLSPNNVETYLFPASASGSQAFSLTHQYLDDNPTGTPFGTYIIGVDVLDDDMQGDVGALLAGPGTVIDGTTLTGASSPSINDAGDIAFLGVFEEGGSSQLGVFTANKLIATAGDVIDGRTIAAINGDVTINDLGQVAFLAQLSGGRGAFIVDTATGGGQFVVGSGSVIDGVTIQGLFDIQINDSGDFVMVASFVEPGASQSTNGLFTQDALIARIGDTIGDKTISSFFSPSINDAGDVIFVARFANSSAGTGVFTPDGLLLAAGDVIDGKTLTGNFFSAAVNDAGDILVLGDFSGGRGIFTQTELLYATPSGAPVGGKEIVGLNEAVLNDSANTLFQGVFSEDGVWQGGVFLLPQKSVSASTTVGVTNLDPDLAVSLTGASINENDSATLSGTISDTGSLDTFSLNLDWGDPLSPQDTQTFSLGTVALTEATDGINWDPNTRQFSLSHEYLDDNGTGDQSNVYTINATVTDDDLGAASATATITVNNVSPTDVAIDTSINDLVIAVGETATFRMQSAFADVGTLDTHTAEWSFSHIEGQVPVDEVRPGTLTQGTGSGSVEDEFSFDEPGVYTVVLTVTDDDTGQQSSLPVTFVVYDPSAGFVTGNGTIESPAGAYAPDPTLAGEGRFIFLSRYRRGTNVPTGETQFRFAVGDLDFRSSSYEWLVVAGARAQYKGSGTINGEGDFGFLLTAIDGQVNGGGGSDKFRIKIWDMNNGDAVVYDNQIGEGDDSPVTTELTRGRVMISQGGKKVLGTDVKAGHASPLTQSTLAPAVDRAIGYWTSAGLATRRLHQLHAVDIVTSSLPGSMLGLASTSTNLVWIDRDAAGYGWSVDAGGYDLVSVLTHEFGHVLGYDHGVMGSHLEAGERNLDWLHDDDHVAHDLAATLFAGQGRQQRRNLNSPDEVSDDSLSPLRNILQRRRIIDGLMDTMSFEHGPRKVSDDDSSDSPVGDDTSTGEQAADALFATLAEGVAIED